MTVSTFARPRPARPAARCAGTSSSRAGTEAP